MISLDFWRSEFFASRHFAKKEGIDREERTLALLLYSRHEIPMPLAAFDTRGDLPAGMVRETVDQLIAHWQIKRDESRHGIVEIIEERTP